MNKIRILFVCIHNSARSQMAMTYLNALGGDRFQAESAGLEPGILNPYVVKVMQEEGLDISQNSVNSVFDFFKEGRLYDYVISVCDESRAQACPIFPGITRRLAWSFSDPSEFTGTEEEILDQNRQVRDQIRQKIQSFIQHA